MIVVGAHFGAIEVPVIYLSARAGYPFMAPMETVADPGLQAWIEQSRRRAGIAVVPLARRPARAPRRPSERGAPWASSPTAT